MNSHDSRQPFIPASTPRSADVVLYLDLDGVVQHEAVLYDPRKGIYMSPAQVGHVLFEWVPILEGILQPFPNVALVLSSTWCIRPGYAKTLELLPSSLRARFIGGTYHRRIHGTDPASHSVFRDTARGLQIWADVQRRKPRQWLAIDDDVQDWPQWAVEHLVTCDGTTGLSDTRVQAELATKLARCHEALSNGRGTKP